MRSTHSARKDASGVTLIELMIVIAVIAILASVGYPIFTDYMRKTRRADGKSMLLQVMQAQERNYTANSTYTTDLTTLGYASAANVPSDDGFYQVSAAACGTGITSCVQLTAAPQGAQNQDSDCLTLSLNSQGVQNATGTLGASCW